MTIVKQEAIDLIQALPDTCSFSDIMAELYFKLKVSRGLRDVEEGNTISHEEVKERMKKWAKSVGQ